MDRIEFLHMISNESGDVARTIVESFWDQYMLVWGLSGDVVNATIQLESPYGVEFLLEMVNSSVRDKVLAGLGQQSLTMASYGTTYAVWAEPYEVLNNRSIKVHVANV